MPALSKHLKCSLRFTVLIQVVITLFAVGPVPLVFPAEHHTNPILLSSAEDVDPSVGRFRNMVQTAVVPVKVGGML